ncbi:MAG: 2-C-methyl-D-erythritol 4-phosphate cytidylyltransferase, partial [Verrucomicrobia bacterium]|nr:2-C-methyl-D-erythritol 4-phosphate cytidylyltransferase [Verrucomicrobiota bacterium]
MKAEAIIVAAGQGKRMGGKIDKIFLEVAGTPIIVHTWRRFEAIDDIQKIIFVIRAELEND